MNRLLIGLFAICGLGGEGGVTRLLARSNTLLFVLERR